MVPPHPGPTLFPYTTLFRSASKVGVSRKIENREQRAKLRDMVSKLVPKEPGAGGWIIRTVAEDLTEQDRKSTRLNSSHTVISYAVFCLKKKKQKNTRISHNP